VQGVAGGGCDIGGLATHPIWGNVQPTGVRISLLHKKNGGETHQGNVLKDLKIEATMDTSAADD
jgi:hypothetical protein